MKISEKLWQEIIAATPGYFLLICHTDINRDGDGWIAWLADKIPVIGWTCPATGPSGEYFYATLWQAPMIVEGDAHDYAYGRSETWGLLLPDGRVRVGREETAVMLKSMGAFLSHCVRKRGQMFRACNAMASFAASRLSREECDG
jgi:hypothetical protein